MSDLERFHWIVTGYSEKGEAYLAMTWMSASGSGSMRSLVGVTCRLSDELVK